jgi:hypothetical protein
MYIIEPALTGIELHFDELHLAAKDAEVNLVCPSSGNNRWRRGRRFAGRRAGKVRGELRNILEGRPVLQTLGKHQRVPVDRAVSQIGDDIVLRNGSDLMPADGHVPLLL